MASGHRWNIVGDEFVRLVVAEYESDGALHWPTAIAATACLCGETALVANESRLPEFGVVESRRVADFVHGSDMKNRTIWGYCTTVAKQAFSVEIENLPAYRDVVELLGVQLLPGSFPALSVPMHVAPQETPMNAGPRLRKKIHAIAEKEGLAPSDSSFALATAAMKMIGSVQEIGVRDLTVLALQCGVAGSRFAPSLQQVDNPAMQRRGGVQPTSVFAPPALDEDEQEELKMPAAAAVAAALSPGAERVGFGKRR